MGHGQLYRRDWDTLFQEEKDRDYAMYFREKYYPKGFIIALMFLGLMSGVFQLTWFIGGDLQEKEGEQARGARMYEVSVIPREKELPMLIERVDKVMIKKHNPVVKTDMSPAVRTVDIPELSAWSTPIEELEEESNGFVLTEEEWIELEEEVVPEVIPQPEIDNFDGWLIDPEEPQLLNYEEVMKSIYIPGRCGRYNDETIIVGVLVGKKGEYLKHRIIQSHDPILRKAVEKQVPLLIFTPAIGPNNKPHIFWVNVPFKIHFLD